MAFYLEKGSKWASVNRLTDLWLRPIVSVTPVNTLSVSEPIKAVCENKKNNADQILPSGGKVVLLLCHPLGFLRVLTVRVGVGV